MEHSSSFRLSIGGGGLASVFSERALEAF